jgi:signal transduction histidine kinase
MSRALSRWGRSAAFFVIVSATGVVACLALLNIVRWSDEPIFGYFIRATGQPCTVGLVLAPGRDAGLAVGDRIVAVNGHPVASLGEIRKHRQTGPTSSNAYVVQRGPDRMEVTIPTRPLGLANTLWIFGLPWAVGVVFIVLGVVVFLMKRWARDSWAFLHFSCLSGLFILFLYRNVLEPAWLNTVAMASLAFLPAALLHLAVRFPEDRLWFGRRPLGQLLPYAVSLLLTIVLLAASSNWEDIPLSLKTTWLVYLALATAGFLGATAYTHWWSMSAIARLRARAVLLGFGVATFVPVSEAVLNAVANVYVLPHSNWFVPFFVFIPLAVGYAIVKHNLFDIDAVIRRSTGYLAITAVVVVVYTSLLAVFDLGSRRLTAAQSPALPVLTTLILIAILNPLRNRVQRVVDRVFYRAQSDYRETVRRMTEALTSVIALDVVIDRVVGTLTHDMSIGTATMLLRAEPGSEYREYRAGTFADVAPGIVVPTASAVVELLSRTEVDVLARDDVADDPAYQAWRGDILAEFDRLDATLLVPLTFTGDLIGLLAVGKKRSGRSYTAEDVALLTTLAHESAIAINNATAYKKLEDFKSTLEDRVRERTDELAILNVKLEQSNARLRELDRLKSESVSDVSHELRTPLTAIQGYVEYLLEGIAGDVTPMQREFLERVRINSERLTRLITDLLDLGRIEAGKVELRPARLSVSQAIGEVVAELSTLAREKSITLTGVAPVSDLLVVADRDKLHQILLNLGHNAVKFTRAGGSVRLGASAGDQGAVVITVADTGQGLSADEVQKVFEMFYQAGDADPGTGSGLGLTITKKLVELHGGSIRVTSERGQGSVFTVALPGAATIEAS